MIAVYWSTTIRFFFAYNLFDIFIKYCNIMETWNIYKWYNYIQSIFRKFINRNFRIEKNYKYSHEEAIVIFNMEWFLNVHTGVIEDDEGKTVEF